MSCEPEKMRKLKHMKQKESEVMWNRAKEKIKAHETDTNKKRKAGETDELRKFRQ